MKRKSTKSSKAFIAAIQAATAAYYKCEMSEAIKRGIAHKKAQIQLSRKVM
jgi:hypothetical protein